MLGVTVEVECHVLQYAAAIKVRKSPAFLAPITCLALVKLECPSLCLDDKIDTLLIIADSLNRDGADLFTQQPEQLFDDPASFMTIAQLIRIAAGFKCH